MRQLSEQQMAREGEKGKSEMTTPETTEELPYPFDMFEVGRILGWKYVSGEADWFIADRLINMERYESWPDYEAKYLVQARDNTHIFMEEDAYEWYTENICDPQNNDEAWGAWFLKGDGKIHKGIRAGINEATDFGPLFEAIKVRIAEFEKTPTGEAVRQAEADTKRKNDEWQRLQHDREVFNLPRTREKLVAKIAEVHPNDKQRRLHLERELAALDARIAELSQ